MRVIAGEQMHPVDVAGTLLDGAEIAATGDAVEEILAHVDPHAARVVVEHDREVRRPVDRQGIQGVFALRGHRIGRRSDENGRSADLGRRLGHQDRVRQTDSDCAYGERHAIDFFGELRHFDAFVHRLRIVFARRPADDDAVHT